MDQTLVAWKNTASLALVAKLPLQTYSKASLLVESYIASTGGWIPDNPADPTGIGHPASGLSPEQAAETIATEQYNRIYAIEATVDVKVKFSMHQNLAPGQTKEAIEAAIKTMAEDWVREQMSDVPVTIETSTLSSITMTTNGNTTREQRLVLQQAVSQSDHLTDPKALALKSARSLYNLDIFWNVASFYTEADQSLVVFVKKYRTAGYVDQDPLDTTTYVIGVDGGSFTVVNGLRLNT